jgi:hypothetical protein
MDPYLHMGRWYMQSFKRDPAEDLYFMGDTLLKNGRMQGPMVEVQPGHPRRKPTVKRVSVHPQHDASLWKPVFTSEVPEKVQEAAATKRSPSSGDMRRSRRSRRSRRAGRSRRR